MLSVCAVLLGLSIWNVYTTVRVTYTHTLIYFSIQETSKRLKISRPEKNVFDAILYAPFMQAI